MSIRINLNYAGGYVVVIDGEPAIIVRTFDAALSYVADLI